VGGRAAVRVGGRGRGRGRGRTVSGGADGRGAGRRAVATVTSAGAMAGACVARWTAHGGGAQRRRRRRRVQSAEPERCALPPLRAGRSPTCARGALRRCPWLVRGADLGQARPIAHAGALPPAGHLVKNGKRQGWRTTADSGTKRWNHIETRLRHTKTRHDNTECQKHNDTDTSACCLAHAPTHPLDASSRTPAHPALQQKTVWPPPPPLMLPPPQCP